MSATAILPALLSLAAGYLLGSVNTSLVMSKFYRADIRQQGSGNAGLTNTMRVWGKKAAAVVLLGDVLKGLLSCLIGMLLASIVAGVFGIKDVDGQSVRNLGIIAGGLGAVVGHNWPIYFGFKGGKGVLTTIAVIAFTDWRIMLVLLGVFLVVLAIFRYVSLGSVLGAACFPVVSAFMGKGPEYIIFALILAVLIIIRHSANIKRLLRGAENRFSWKKPVRSDDIRH